MFAAAAAAAIMLALSGCAAGKDAVAVGGSFSFVAPGGQDRIRYEPPTSRGRVGGLVGQSLSQPGRAIGVRDFPGQVVVLNVWGSWCGPCRTEAPDLQLTYQRTHAAGVTVLGIDVRDNSGAARDFTRSYHLTYPMIFDPAGRSLLALRGFPRNTVPSTIVLDRQHRVAAIFLTALRASELIPVVDQVAAEHGAEPAATSSGPTGRAGR